MRKYTVIKSPDPHQHPQEQALRRDVGGEMWGITHLNEVCNTATPHLYFLRNHAPELILTGTTVFSPFSPGLNILY